MTNSIIDLITNHKSIRHFKNQQLTDEEVDTLVNAATHASTSTFSQQYSIISVTDPQKLAEIERITGGKKWLLGSGHYFVLIADQYRNLQIAKRAGADPYVLKTTDKFLASVFDASLATENLVLAAESMGMGATIMGSILNDSKRMIEILGLPELTFPLLGVAVGYPESEPETKPRLPQKLQHFTNTYQLDSVIANFLPEYDLQISDYYSSRGSNNRVETFSNHILSELTRDKTIRADLLTNIAEQGFAVDKLLKPVDKNS